MFARFRRVPYHLVGTQHGEELASPPWQSYPNSANPLYRLRHVGFYSAAVIAGILLHMFFVSTTYPSLSSSTLTTTTSMSESCPLRPVSDAARIEPFTRPGLGHLVDAAAESEWTDDKLKAMVAATKGYYARDYSLWLGWNNMRYIIEAAVLHAHLLNRTLILPPFVYLRACEHNITVCGQYAEMVDRKIALMWKMPIEIMIDVNMLRKQIPVVTLDEYFRFNNIRNATPDADGQWNISTYHHQHRVSETENEKSDVVTYEPSLRVIENKEYEPKRTVRVDRLPRDGGNQKPPLPGTPERQVYNELMVELSTVDYVRTIPFDDAQMLISLRLNKTWHTEGDFLKTLDELCFRQVYSFGGRIQNFEKTVTDPVRAVAPCNTMLGLQDDFSDISEEVLLIRGELHDLKKAGSLWFTSLEPRAWFADAILRGSVHLPSFIALADIIASHMLALNGGRMWMAAHIRRGDFADLKWALEDDMGKYLDRIEQQMFYGRELLDEIASEGEGPLTYDVPHVTPDKSFEHAGLPLPEDKWLMATDERDPEALALARKRGAVTITEILKDHPTERRIVGWPLLFSDILMLLEQDVMARAAVFIAHARSSVAGGVVNIRAARGMDRRTAILEDRR